MMTLKEFREATKDMDENAIIIIDATDNPAWYLVEKPRLKDGQTFIYMVDKTGIDLPNEIEATLEALSETEAISYLLRNGVTLEEMKDYSDDLYQSAKRFVEE